MEARWIVAWLVLAHVGVAPARAQAQRGDLAPASDALPGALRVGFATPTEVPRLTFSGTGGYGFIEGASGEGGDHHRVQGGLALAVRPIEWLAFAVGADGRWDIHPSDDSGVGVPWIAARAGTSLVEELALGLDVRFDAHGADAPSIDPLGSRLSVRGLLTARPMPALRLGLAAGVRFDGTGRTVDRAGGTTYGAGDLVSLGVSDSDAVLIGLAASYDVGGFELLGELTWEPLFGERAPALERSPLRVGVGGRVELVRGLGAQLWAELTTQPREPVQLDQLVEVEPRVRVLASLSYRFDLAERDEEPPPDADEPAPLEPDEAEPTDARMIRGAVRGPDGAPIAAHVRVLDSEAQAIAEGQTDADGRFAIEVPPETTGTLEIEAEGFAPSTRPLPADGAPADVELAPVEPVGTLRGLVRSFSGRPVEATIAVDGGEPVTTDQDGVFEVEVAAGAHEIEIAARRYRTQTRRVTVEQNGVTILNVDLRRAR